MKAKQRQQTFGQGLMDDATPQPLPNAQQNVTDPPRDYDLSAASHPFCCIFTFAFKAAAFIIYFFFGFFFSLVTTFILVTILGAIDFWIVKNVTGRLLVGLRWWSDFDERGKEVWRFQSYDREHKPKSVDSAFFWTSQLAGTITWAAFLVLKVLSLDFFWAMLVFINFSLCGTNLYGYYKCRGQHNKKLDELKKRGLTAFVGRFFG